MAICLFGSVYNSEAILANFCTFEYQIQGPFAPTVPNTQQPNRGVKTSSVTSVRQTPGSPSWLTERTDSYGYDSQLDYLTGATYGDGLPNANPSWSYDPAGMKAAFVRQLTTQTFEAEAMPIASVSLSAQIQGFYSGYNTALEISGRLLGLWGPGTDISNPNQKEMDNINGADESAFDGLQEIQSELREAVDAAEYSKADKIVDRTNAQLKSAIVARMRSRPIDLAKLESDQRKFLPPDVFKIWQEKVLRVLVDTEEESKE